MYIVYYIYIYLLAKFASILYLYYERNINKYNYKSNI